jgi:hypothetical protein
MHVLADVLALVLVVLQIIEVSIGLKTNRR